MSADGNMVTVRSLDGASLTFTKKGEEIHFKNSVATVTVAVAKELVDRQHGRYVIFDKSAIGVKTAKPSFENLEMEYQALAASQGNLPKLKEWISNKMSEIGPALLTFQQQTSAPILPGQQAVTNPPNNMIVESGPEVIPDVSPENVDMVPVDGVDESPPLSSSLSRAEKVLE